MKNKDIRKVDIGIFGVIFLAVGLCLLAAGAVFLRHEMSIAEDSAVVKAVISDIRVTSGVDGDREYTAYVDYTYDGKRYKSVKLSEYSSLMYEGDRIELYADRDRPDRVSVKSMIYFVPILLFGLGAVFAVLGMIPIVIRRKQKKRFEKLMSSGLRIYGEVQGGGEERSYTIRGRHPYRFKCVYEDILSGQPVICMSDITWENPEDYIGQPVLIYVDENDRSHYYVALDSLMGHTGIME